MQTNLRPIRSLTTFFIKDHWKIQAIKFRSLDLSDQENYHNLVISLGAHRVSYQLNLQDSSKVLAEEMFNSITFGPTGILKNRFRL